MTVLGIDTASRVGGVAVVDQGRLLGQYVLGIEERHAETLLPVMERLMDDLDLQPAGIDGIAVSVGPGSFTGLRIGLAVAKGLAYAWGTPLRAIGTLPATAWLYRGVDGIVCAALDARRGSVYAAAYDARTLDADIDGETGVLVAEDRIEAKDMAALLLPQLLSGRTLVLVGDGSPLMEKCLHEALEDHGQPSPSPTIEDRIEPGNAQVATAKAGFVVRMPMEGESSRPAAIAHLGEIELAAGKSDDPFELVPKYLRRSEAERRWKQRQKQS